MKIVTKMCTKKSYFRELGLTVETTKKLVLLKTNFCQPDFING